MFEHPGRKSRVQVVSCAALLALAAAASGPAAAQQVPQEGPEYAVVLLSALLGQDGARQFYSGAVSWTNQEGDSTESVNAYVTKGKVACKGTFRSPEGVVNINGPGLIEMSLGLPGGEYSLRVACPDPSTPSQPADFRHSFDTYKQPGGKVEFDRQKQQAKMPRVVQGSYSEPYDDGGSIRMNWKLCTSGCAPPP